MNHKTRKSLHVIDKFLVALRCTETVTHDQFWYLYTEGGKELLLNSIREAEREPS